MPAIGVPSTASCMWLSRGQRIPQAVSAICTSAEQFLHVPYLWGGKTSLGLDCSALVQIALTACGIRCPRDSHMQEAVLGTPIAGIADLKRGDLLFWKGHVAIARDARTLIHANAFHMAVVIEPIAEALARIAAAGSGLTSVRRIDARSGILPIVP